MKTKTAHARSVGLTIETRPSHGKLVHGNELLRFGCTRVELGIQTTFDDALRQCIGIILLQIRRSRLQIFAILASNSTFT
jgi:coproporphyrinogen III oxidase-like Fe-S oxidoreductase